MIKTIGFFIASVVCLVLMSLLPMVGKLIFMYGPVDIVSFDTGSGPQITGYVVLPLTAIALVLVLLMAICINKIFD